MARIPLFISAELQLRSMPRFQCSAHGNSAGTWHILPTAHPCAASSRDRNTKREIILLSPPLWCRKPTHPLQTGTAPRGQLVTWGKIKKKNKIWRAIIAIELHFPRIVLWKATKKAVFTWSPSLWVWVVHNPHAFPTSQKHVWSWARTRAVLAELSGRLRWGRRGSSQERDFHTGWKHQKTSPWAKGASSSRPSQGGGKAADDEHLGRWKGPFHGRGVDEMIFKSLPTQTILGFSEGWDQRLERCCRWRKESLAIPSSFNFSHKTFMIKGTNLLFSFAPLAFTEASFVSLFTVVLMVFFFISPPNYNISNTPKNSVEKKNKQQSYSSPNRDR